MIELTDRQTNAVNEDGLIVVNACPGSGKTTIVAHRLRRLTEQKQLLEYQGVAVLSFTNVAKEAVFKMYSELAGAPVTYPHFVGTIDSFLNRFFIRVVCHRLLFKKTEKAIILDVNSRWVDNIFPRLKQFRLSGQNITYDRDGNVIYQQKNRTLDSEKQAYIENVKRHLKRINIITQSDVSYFCLTILRTYPSYAKAIIDRFPYIIIDEAQDCSDTQMAIVDELKQLGHTEIMLLGDPFQSIYEWRDANPQLLIDKEQDDDWQSLAMTETQRCGNNICEFLNKFHTARTISPDVNRTELRDAEVIARHYDDFNNALNAFLDHVRTKEIEVNYNNVAVLYGGHKSVANVRKSKIDEEALFAVSEADIQALPLRAKIYYDRSQFKQAYECISRYCYFAIERERLKSYRQLREHELAEISNKIRIWNTCKKIPSLQMSLLDWINATNIELNEVMNDLGAEFVELKKKRNQADIPNLQEALLIDLRAENFRDITIQNIHQIKGRTFDAVMIYVDSGRGRWKLTVNKIKESLTQHDLFGSDHLDDTRCFYVAASRARRLLWICSEDSEIVTILN